MLQEAVDVFVTALAQGAVAEARGSNRNTVVAYRNDLYQFCAFLELQYNLTTWPQVTQEMIVEYLQEMRERMAYRPTTIARKLAALKSFFRFLCGRDLLAFNPVERLESPRIEKDLPQVLSAEQIGVLLRQVGTALPGGQRDLAMLQVLHTTGMRVTELVSLNVADFDTVYSLIVCPGRNGRQRRQRRLPLSAEVIEVLSKYLEQARPRLAARHPEEEALFVNHHGERLTRQGFWLIVKSYARQAGIQEITPHMLRHSFALLMVEEGKELRSVQEMLGHAHISTTQIYSQLARAKAIAPV